MATVTPLPGEGGGFGGGGEKGWGRGVGWGFWGLGLGGGLGLGYQLPTMLQAFLPTRDPCSSTLWGTPPQIPILGGGGGWCFSFALSYVPGLGLAACRVCQGKPPFSHHTKTKGGGGWWFGFCLGVGERVFFLGGGKSNCGWEPLCTKKKGVYGEAEA